MKDESYNVGWSCPRTVYTSTEDDKAVNTYLEKRRSTDFYGGYLVGWLWIIICMCLFDEVYPVLGGFIAGLVFVEKYL